MWTLCLCYETPWYQWQIHYYTCNFSNVFPIFVLQSGPTDLRHFDPEFTHLPVSSSLCTDTLTVTSSVKEAAGAFPGFSYGPPAEHSFMWSPTFLPVCPENEQETGQKHQTVLLWHMDQTGAACLGGVIRGSNWQEHWGMRVRSWVSLCMTSVQMEDSHVTTQLALQTSACL